MHIHIHTYTFIYSYLYIYIYNIGFNKHMRIHTYMHIYIYIYGIAVSLSRSVSPSLSLYVYIYTHIYIRIYVCTYTHTGMHTYKVCIYIDIHRQTFFLTTTRAIQGSFRPALVGRNLADVANVAVSHVGFMVVLQGLLNHRLVDADRMLARRRVRLYQSVHQLRLRLVRLHNGFVRFLDVLDHILMVFLYAFCFLFCCWGGN